MPEQFRIHLGPKAAEHPGVEQPAHPGVGVRTGDVELLGERADGHSPVAAQFINDLTVTIVNLLGQVSHL